jgi:uncharacterized LabA/DUF88 family protein
MSDRATLFIDGNNWYHSLKENRVADLGRLDYRKISEKLVGPREWIETRYYIGRVTQRISEPLYDEQRKFIRRLEATDSRIHAFFGRLESRHAKNEAAAELRRYLADIPTRIDQRVFRDLMEVARRHEHTEVIVEKAVDVMLAVDIVLLALRDEFDAAYILSADGDYTPAAKAARDLNKKVYAASPASGAKLAAAVNTFISLEPYWFRDCYLD